MLRRSNLVPGAPALFGQEKHLTRADVTVDAARYALRLRVHYSKTLQFQDRVHDVWVQGDARAGAPLDPVRVWQGYVAAVLAPADSPAFCFLDTGGELRSLTFDLLADGIKQLVGAVGLDPAHYSTHSLRRRGATWAFEYKVHTLFIKAAGDWSSDAYEAYRTLGPSEKLQCTGTMLRALPG